MAVNILLFLIFYVLLGIGAAKLEAHANPPLKPSWLVGLCWPIAMLYYAFE